MRNLFSFMALALMFTSGSDKESAGGAKDAPPLASKDLEATAADTGELSALDDQPTDNASGSTVPGTTGATHKIGDMLNLGPALGQHVEAEKARRGSTLSEDWAAGRVPQETLGQPSHITVNEADLRQGQGIPPNKAAESLDQQVAPAQPVAEQKEAEQPVAAQKTEAAQPQSTAKPTEADKAEAKTTGKK